MLTQAVPIKQTVPHNGKGKIWNERENYYPKISLSFRSPSNDFPVLRFRMVKLKTVPATQFESHLAII